MIQKTNFDFRILLIGIIFLIAALCSCNNAEKTVKSNIPYSIENDTNAFHRMDILLPDYAHSDTLIVFNADALNTLFDGVDLPVPATDSEIDSVLHKYCLDFNQYIEFNIGQGYSPEIALHLALVDFGRIKKDDLYISIMED